MDVFQIDEKMYQQIGGLQKTYSYFGKP